MVSTNGSTMGSTIGSAGVPVDGTGGIGPFAAGGAVVVVVLGVEPPGRDPPPPVGDVVDPDRPAEACSPAGPGADEDDDGPLAAARTKSTGARSSAEIRFVTIPSAAVTSWS